MRYVKSNAPRLLAKHVTHVSRPQFIGAYLTALRYKLQFSVPVLRSGSLRFGFRFALYSLKLLTRNFKRWVSSEIFTTIDYTHVDATPGVAAAGICNTAALMVQWPGTSALGSCNQSAAQPSLRLSKTRRLTAGHLRLFLVA